MGPLSPSDFRQKFSVDSVSVTPSGPLLEDAPEGASLDFWTHRPVHVWGRREGSSSPPRSLPPEPPRHSAATVWPALSSVFPGGTGSHNAGP